MRADEPLSDFDVLRWNRLPNWGRWGRHDPDRPNCQQLSASICVHYIPDGEDWLDEAPEAPPAKINHKDAEDLDGYVQQLMSRNRRQFDAIGLFFYKRRLVSWDRLDEAIRALLDIMDENRRVVDRMYELIYRREGNGGSA